jgi:drug/metabolite transporter (DMT)-like permease
MAALLALASALCYGVSDFVGGLLARRASFVAVAFLGQAGGLVCAAVVAPLASTSPPGWADLGWGALSGVGTGIAMMFLFRGLSRGEMTVVVPASAVGGVAVPVLVGVLLWGERPPVLSWAGIALAVPALWLVSAPGGRPRPAVSPAVLDGLIAGLAIALQYVALAQSGPQSGLWPVLSGRAAAVLTVLPLLLRTHASLRGRTAILLAGAGTGVAAALALSCFLLATRHQLVAIAVVLSSLYPVVPVLLGVTVLHERVTRRRLVGLVVAGMAIALLAVP